MQIEWMLAAFEAVTGFYDLVWVIKNKFNKDNKL
jgi:hypothetical protein